MSMQSMTSRAALAAVVAMSLASLAAQTARGATVVFDFEDGTDQGFGAGFGDDASKNFSIVDIGGSKRMAVPLGGFQVAGRQGTTDPFLGAINAAVSDPSGYVISYDWYVDTAPGGFGNFLQLATYLNSGSGAYTQDFPNTNKDVELDGAQLASGGVFSGTVSETLTAKYGALDPGFLGQTFMRFGFIMNGDGTNVTVYFDNVTIAPVPEPSTVALVGLGLAAYAGLGRRRRA